MQWKEGAKGCTIGVCKQEDGRSGSASMVGNGLVAARYSGRRNKLSLDFACAIGLAAAWQTSLILPRRTLNHFRSASLTIYPFLFSLPPCPPLLLFCSIPILYSHATPPFSNTVPSRHKLCSLAGSVTMPVYTHTLCRTCMGGGGRGRGRWSGRGGRV